MPDNVPDDYPDPVGWKVTYSSTYDGVKYHAPGEQIMVIVREVSTSSGDVYNCQAFVSEGPYGPKTTPRGAEIAESVAAITTAIDQLKENQR